jgi:hypothetical protein
MSGFSADDLTAVAVLQERVRARPARDALTLSPSPKTCSLAASSGCASCRYRPRQWMLPGPPEPRRTDRPRRRNDWSVSASRAIRRCGWSGPTICRRCTRRASPAGGRTIVTVRPVRITGFRQCPRHPPAPLRLPQRLPAPCHHRGYARRPRHSDERVDQRGCPDIRVIHRDARAIGTGRGNQRGIPAARRHRRDRRPVRAHSARAHQPDSVPTGTTARARHRRRDARQHTVSFTLNGTPVTVKGYPAKPGYDPVTGVGTIDAARFVPELAAANLRPAP